MAHEVRLVGRSQNWRPLPNDSFAFMNTFDRAMIEVDATVPARLPDFSGSQRLLIVSDYGGQHQAAAFESYSFLIVDQDALQSWVVSSTAARGLWLPDERRMSYKELREATRSRALEPFLTAADGLNGVLVVIAVDREIGSLFRPGSGPLKPPPDGWAANWQPSSYERMLRVTNLAGFLVAGLSQPGQDVQWVSDEDATLATENHLKDFIAAFARASTVYLQHKMGNFAIGTVRGNRRLEDLAALPDLTAGAIAEFLAAEETRNVSPFTVPFPTLLPTKVGRICRWLSMSGLPLKRLVFAVDRHCETGKTRLRAINFVDLMPPGLFA